MSSGTDAIKKLHVEATANFAISHIPTVDEDTLVKFVELVNIAGNFGTIKKEQVAFKMTQILKYIPGACEQTLRTVGDLLDVPFPEAEAPGQSHPETGKVVGSITPPSARTSMPSAARWAH